MLPPLPVTAILICLAVAAIFGARDVPCAHTIRVTCPASTPTATCRAAFDAAVAAATLALNE